MSYSCYNHPETDRLTTIQVQDGWTADGCKIMVPKTTQWIKIQCGHDESYKDTECNGCRWQKDGP